MPDRTAPRPVLAAAAALALAAPAAADPYRDPGLRVTVEPPTGWRMMTAEELTRGNDFARRRAPGRSIGYVAGFRHRAGEYPFALVQVERCTTAGTTLDDLHQAVARQREEVTRLARQAAADVARDMTLETPSLDRQGNRVFYRAAMTDRDGGKTLGKTYMHLGAEGVVTVHCYAEARDFGRQEPVFDRLSKSVRFDPGYEFNPGTGLRAGRVDFGLAIQHGIMAGAVAGAVGVVITVFRFLIRKLAG